MASSLLWWRRVMPADLARNEADSGATRPEALGVSFAREFEFVGGGELSGSSQSCAEA